MASKDRSPEKPVPESESAPEPQSKTLREELLRRGRRALRRLPTEGPLEEAVRALYEGRYPEATATLERLVQSQERAGPAYFYLGMAHFLQGDYESAVLAFGAAIQRQYTDPAALERLGDALFLLERYEEAAEAYRAALHQNANAPGYVRLGQVYLALGRRQEALDAFKEAIRHRLLGIGSMQETQDVQEDPAHRPQDE